MVILAGVVAALVWLVVVVGWRWWRRWRWALRRMERLEAERAAWVQIAHDAAGVARLYRAAAGGELAAVQESADRTVPMVDAWPVGPDFCIFTHRN